MKFRLKPSKCLIMCFGITTLLLLITGRYLWIGPTVDDNWNSSFLKDSSLNHSLSGGKLPSVVGSDVIYHTRETVFHPFSKHLVAEYFDPNFCCCFYIDG